MKEQYYQLLQRKDRHQHINGFDLIKTKIQNFELLIKFNFRIYELNGVIWKQELLKINQSLQILQDTKLIKL